MPALVFDLNIPKEDFIAWYQGSAKEVLVYARTGERLRFPANRLLPFVSHEGVRGSFVIEFDDAFKFKALQRYTL